MFYEPLLEMPQLTPDPPAFINAVRPTSEGDVALASGVGQRFDLYSAVVFPFLSRYLLLRRDYFVMGSGVIGDSCTVRDQELVSQLLAATLELTQSQCHRQDFRSNEVLACINALLRVQDFRPGEADGAPPLSNITSAQNTLSLALVSLRKAVAGDKAAIAFANSTVLPSLRVFLRHNNSALHVSGGPAVVEQLQDLFGVLLSLGTDNTDLLDSTATSLALSDCLHFIWGCIPTTVLEQHSTGWLNAFSKGGASTQLNSMLSELHSAVRGRGELDKACTVAVPLLSGYAMSFAADSGSSIASHIGGFMEDAIAAVAELGPDSTSRALALSSFLQYVASLPQTRLPIRVFEPLRALLVSIPEALEGNDCVYLVDRINTLMPIWATYARTHFSDSAIPAGDNTPEEAFLRAIVAAHAAGVRSAPFVFQVRLARKDGLSDAATLAFNLLVQHLPGPHAAIVHDGCDLLRQEGTTMSRLVAAIDRVLDVGSNTFEHRATLRSHLVSLSMCHHLLATRHTSVANTKARSAWRRVFSAQRKKQVVRMFKMAPLCRAHERIPSHCINLFLQGFHASVLQAIPPLDVHSLIVDLTTEAPVPDDAPSDASPPDRVRQLIAVFTDSPVSPELFLKFLTMLCKSCTGAEVYSLDMVEGDDDDDDDDDDDGDADNSGAEDSLEAEQRAQEVQRRRETRQTYLCDRGAARMAFQLIGNCHGHTSAVVRRAVKLAIALLNGGNTTVQQAMLSLLREGHSPAFFPSLQQLLSECTVVDLDHLRRISAVKPGQHPLVQQQRALDGMREDVDFVCDLFRCLQLLCEGHFEEFQNYLRAQPGSNITANIIVDSVDYLLRLQESIADMFVHEPAGAHSPVSMDILNSSIRIGTQVFRTLTEYMQGPCEGNQNSLSQSRLWDAVGGFLLFFAEMQSRLARDPSQIELLKEIREMLVCA
jgi:hypothetical protein